MGKRSWFRKVALVLCSTILLGIECPPLVIDSFKSGVVNWVSGSFNSFDLTPFTDFIINSFSGGPSQLS